MQHLRGLLGERRECTSPAAAACDCDERCRRRRVLGCSCTLLQRRRASVCLVTRDADTAKGSAAASEATCMLNSPPLLISHDACFRFAGEMLHGSPHTGTRMFLSARNHRPLLLTTSHCRRRDVHDTPPAVGRVRHAPAIVCSQVFFQRQSPQPSIAYCFPQDPSSMAVQQTRSHAPSVSQQSLALLLAMCLKAFAPLCTT